MKVREIFSFRRLKGAAVLFALLLSIVGSLVITSYTRAAGDVVLTGSAFSDPDAEDTHKASQWIITDASGGGNTIYDSGTDAANLTTITVSGAFFSAGTTYYWKVRYQDNHDVWSDYSDESSFAYGGVPTATPTDTPTDTPTATATTTVTTTVTNSVTSTVTVTVTPTVTASTTTTPYCMFGWQILNGEPFCGDAVVGDIYLKDTKPDCNGQLDLEYYVIDSYTMRMKNETLRKAESTDVHDIYYSVDGGASYKRLIHDYDFTTSYSWGKKPVAGGYTGQNYLIVHAKIQLPQEALGSSQFRALVHVYPESSIGSGLNYGNDFIPAVGFNGIKMVYFDMVDLTSVSSQSGCLAPEPTPSATGTASRCLYDFISPQNGDSWTGGSTQQISWVGNNDSSDSNLKINAFFVAANGQNNTSLAVMQPDNGVLTYHVNSENSVSSGRFLIETYNLNNQKISSCTSALVDFEYPGGPSDPVTTASVVLVLGSIFALAASYIVALLSSVPALSRALSSFVLSLFAPPVWSRQKSRWGIVYDAVTKKPIPNVVVRMFSEPDGKLRDSRRSNETGEFGFVVPVGAYSVTASKSGYLFPSHLIVGTSDGQYHNIYKGGEVDVHPAEGGKAPLSINIPLDQTEANILDITVLSGLHFISKVASVVRLPLLALGTVFATYLTITQGRWFDYLILSLYIGLWIFEITDLIKKRTYGVVSDDSSQPVSLAMVRVIDRGNKLRSTVVTGDDGKFIIPLPQGEYRFEASRAGFVTDRTEFIKINKLADIGKINLRMKKLVNKESYPEQDHSRL